MYDPNFYRASICMKQNRASAIEELESKPYPTRLSCQCYFLLLSCICTLFIQASVSGKRGIYNHQTKPSMTPTRPAAIPAICLSALAPAFVAAALLADPAAVLLAPPAAEVPLAAATAPAPVDLLLAAVPVALPEPDVPLRLEPLPVAEAEPDMALNAA